METIDQLRRVPVGPSLLDGAMALVDEAGWNQTEADWRLMGAEGDAAGLVDGGDLVATALAMPYPPHFGWISMVLVRGTLRRRGLATALLRDRIAWLRTRGLVPVLDATEAGQQVYAKLGFALGARFTRWQGQGGGAAPDPARVRAAIAADRARIIDLDQQTFTAERSAVIGDFLDRPDSRCWVAGNGRTGFVIARGGRRAVQIGPLVATDEHEAIALLGAALAGCPGPVILDALDSRTDLAAFIRSRGLERQRGFARMSLGAAPDFDGGGRSMVIAGPEYG